MNPIDGLDDAAAVAENALLGAALQFGGAVVERAGGVVAADDFRAGLHREAWSAAAALHGRGEAVEVVTVFDELERRGRAVPGALPDLNALAYAALRDDNVEAYAQRVADNAQRRRIGDAGTELVSLARRSSNAAEALHGAERLLARLRERGGATTNQIGQARKLRHVFAAEVADEPGDFDDELIEGIIGRAAMAVMYGDSNCGKTFLGVDVGLSIAASMPWMGRNVRPDSAVVYLATEAEASVRVRAAAWQRAHEKRVDRFVIVQSPVDLFNGSGDTEAIVALVRDVATATGCGVGLIIADTLARIATGANENSGEDMSVVLRNADAVRAATGATFLWIHHCGKDAARGLRGWSGIRAAVDTEIEVTADEATGLRCAEITKQRDLPGKGIRLGFKLQAVPVGRNLWGAERSTCVVLSAEAGQKREPVRRTSEVAGAIVETLRARGSGIKKRELVEHLQDRYVSSAVYREVVKMVNAGRLHESVGVVCLVQQESRS